MPIQGATFTDIGGAVSDLFAADADQTKAQADQIKAQGDALEAENYGQAADFATQNIGFTQTATEIKEAQQQRQVTQALGSQQADVAGAGFASSGSALDLLRDSASQGALSKAVLQQQGLITEAGHQEEAMSYTNMSKAADFAVQGDELAAQAEQQQAQGAEIAGVMKGVAAVFSVIPGDSGGGGGGSSTGSGGGSGGGGSGGGGE
jgi:hypothetical protein